MKYKIVKNENRPTLTVIISPTIIGFVKYLFHKYQGSNDKEYFFGSAVLKDANYKDDIAPFLKDLVAQLNEVAAEKLPEGEKITIDQFITMKDDEYRLFGKNLDKDDVWDKQFKISLKSNAKDDDKRFLFKGGMKNPRPVSEDDGWKHYYAIELEIAAGYDEDKFETYVYTIFHRAISVGEREHNSYQKNDSAWGGFDFGEENTGGDNTPTIDVAEDDLPF